MAISVDSVEENKQFRKKLNATFPFLSDSGQKVAKQYTGTEKGGMDAPSVVLVDRQGRVRWRYLGDVTDRPAAAEVLGQLDQIERDDKDQPQRSSALPPCPSLEQSQDR